MGELFIGIILIVLSAAIYYQGGNLPQFGDVNMTAGSYPRLIALFLGGMSLILVIMKIKELIKRSKEGEVLVSRERIKKGLADYRYVIITFVNLGAYVLLMRTIGFLVTTLAFIIGTALCIGPRRPKDIIRVSVTAAAVTFGAYYFFQNLLYVRFPSGILF